jgi:hypothetical protein
MSRNSEDTLDHGTENGNTEKEPKERATDGGERGGKKPEEQEPVEFWHS